MVRYLCCAVTSLMLLGVTGTGNAAPVDRLGDPLPEGAWSRVGTARLRHGDGCSVVASSPDGKVLATGGLDRAARLWDATTGKELRQLTGHTGAVTGLVWSRDNKILITLSQNGPFHVWDATTGKLLLQIGKASQGYRAVALSPDDSLIAVGCIKEGIVLFERTTGKEVRRLIGHKEMNSAVHFSPDGKLLASASGSDRLVCLWDVTTGKEVQRFTGETSTDPGLTFAPDGKTLYVASRAGGIRRWDIRTARELSPWEGHKANVMSVVCSPDGKTLASSSSDQTLRLWDVATEKEIKQLPLPPIVYAMSLNFSPDSKRLAAINGASTGPLVAVWDITSGKRELTFAGHQGGLTSVLLSPDGKTLVTGGEDKTIIFWDAATSQERFRVSNDHLYIQPLAIAPDGSLVATCTYAGTVRLLDAATGKEVRTWQAHSRYISALAFSPDGKILASGADDYHVCTWDVATGKKRGAVDAHPEARPVQGWITALAFAPDGKRFAVSSTSGKTRVFVEATGKVERSFPEAMQVSFVQAGTMIVLGTNTSTVELWDLATGKTNGRIAAYESGVQALAVSPDSRMVATGGRDGAIHLVEIATGQERRVLRGHNDRVTGLQFARDGKTLVSSSMDATALSWDVWGLREQPQHKYLPRELEALWDSLGSGGATAYEAMRSLLQSPQQATELLASRLPPLPEQAWKKLITDLDADEFVVRERASMELERLGAVVVPLLRTTLETTPSPQVTVRVERILVKRNTSGVPREHLRTQRAFEVLEHIGTAEARRVLADLAKKSPDTPLGKEAKTILDRLR